MVTILDQKTSEILFKEETKNLSSAKKLAKSTLKRLGTIFLDEVRNSKYRKRKL